MLVHGYYWHRVLRVVGDVCLVVEVIGVVAGFGVYGNGAVLGTELLDLIAAAVQKGVGARVARIHVRTRHRAGEDHAGGVRVRPLGRVGFKGVLLDCAGQGTGVHSNDRLVVGAGDGKGHILADCCAVRARDCHGKGVGHALAHGQRLHGILVVSREGIGIAAVGIDCERAVGSRAAAGPSALCAVVFRIAVVCGVQTEAARNHGVVGRVWLRPDHCAVVFLYGGLARGDDRGVCHARDIDVQRAVCVGVVLVHDADREGFLVQVVLRRQAVACAQGLQGRRIRKGIGVVAVLGQSKDTVVALHDLHHGAAVHQAVGQAACSVVRIRARECAADRTFGAVFGKGGLTGEFRDLGARAVHKIRAVVGSVDVDLQGLGGGGFCRVVARVARGQGNFVHQPLPGLQAVDRGIVIMEAIAVGGGEGAVAVVRNGGDGQLAVGHGQRAAHSDGRELAVLQDAELQVGHAGGVRGVDGEDARRRSRGIGVVGVVCAQQHAVFRHLGHHDILVVGHKRVVRALDLHGNFCAVVGSGLVARHYGYGDAFYAVAVAQGLHQIGIVIQRKSVRAIAAIDADFAVAGVVVPLGRAERQIARTIVFYIQGCNNVLTILHLERQAIGNGVAAGGIRVRCDNRPRDFIGTAVFGNKVVPVVPALVCNFRLLVAAFDRHGEVPLRDGVDGFRGLPVGVKGFAVRNQGGKGDGGGFAFGQGVDALGRVLQGKGIAAVRV